MLPQPPPPPLPNYSGRPVGWLCAAAVTWPFKPMRVTGFSSHRRPSALPPPYTYVCVYSREMNFGPWFDKCEKFRLKKDPPRLWLLLFALSALASLLSSANFSVTSVAAAAATCRWWHYVNCFRYHLHTGLALLRSIAANSNLLLILVIGCWCYYDF